MRNKGVLFMLGALLAGGWCSRAEATWVNGWWMYPYTYTSHTLVNYRPMSATEKGLSVHDLSISYTPVNSKGLLIGATGVNANYSWAYRWIAIWHCEISHVTRSGPGVHTDFLRIYGQANQDVPTTVLIQDVYIHDGDALPIIVQDGKFDKIVFKDVHIVVPTQVGMQVATTGCGYASTVIVDHCPNTWLHLIGRPGTIGTVYIKNSPGLRVMDLQNQYGKSGAKIVYLN